MAAGGMDAEEPIYRRPLPPEDRVWRHPSEIAGVSRRRRRRRIRLATIGGAGGVVVGVIIWSGADGSAPGVAPDTQVAALISLDTGSTTTMAAADVVDSEIAATIGTVQSETGTETLARALAVRDGGYLITSGRALAGRTELLVVTEDRVVTAVVIGYDRHTDVSVIRTGHQVDPLEVDDGIGPRAGDEVTLVDPTGPDESRVVREPVSTSAVRGGDSLIGVIRLDRPLGDALPGTPTVDRHGDVVGITTATADDAPAAVIPIGIARAVADEIIDFGVASHPLMGVTARDADPDEHAVRGAFVAAVDAEGPAAAGGIEAGDVIISVGDIPVTSLAEMVVALREHEPGEIVAVVVDRGGRAVGCSVELGSVLDAAA